MKLTQCTQCGGSGRVKVQNRETDTESIIVCRLCGGRGNVSTVAKLDYHAVAAGAYRAFIENSGVSPSVAFEDLPRRIQIAWEAAVRQAETELAVSRTFDLTDEERAKFTEVAKWRGWTPEA